MRLAMLEYDFDIHPIADGKLRRFKGPDDNRATGWYVFDGDHGAFGNWKLGLTVKWSEEDRDRLSAEEWAAIQKKIRVAKSRQRSQTKARHKKQARVAKEQWDAAPACLAHPYLSRKGVKPYGLRVHDTYLLIPMLIDGELWNLQRIYSCGDKRYTFGCKVTGCYYPLGTIGDQLWLAEGYATAATLHEVTGDAVACCFNAGNLVTVASHLHRKLPHVRIIIGADNDEAGLAAAERAAAVAGGGYVYPMFDSGDEGSDWNDFEALYGVEWTREVLRGAC